MTGFSYPVGLEKDIRPFLNPNSFARGNFIQRQRADIGRNSVPTSDRIAHIGGLRRVERRCDSERKSIRCGVTLTVRYFCHFLRWTTGTIGSVRIMNRNCFATNTVVNTVALSLDADRMNSRAKSCYGDPIVYPMIVAIPGKDRPYSGGRRVGSCWVLLCRGAVRILVWRSRCCVGTARPVGGSGQGGVGLVRNARMASMVWPGSLRWGQWPVASRSTMCALGMVCCM